MSNSKLFLVENGFVCIRNSNNQEINFPSFDQFYFYCPIEEFNIDLTNIEYICYEPNRPENPFYMENSTTKPIPNNVYEYLIDNFDLIKSRVENPYYNVSLDTAKIYKKNRLKRQAYEIITEKWPLYQQININAGISGSGDKTEKDNDVISIQTECNNKEAEVDACNTIEEVSNISANWPVI